MPGKEWLAKATPEQKARLADKQRDYRATPQGKRTQKIGSWKNQKMICDDWNALYDRFIERTTCECCHNEFKTAKDKHLDHCHKTGNVRNILCRRCNQLRGHIEQDYKLILKLQTMC